MTTEPTHTPEDPSHPLLLLAAQLEDLADAVIAHTVDRWALPARGTRDYGSLLFQLSLVEDHLELSRLVKNLTGHYGWQGALDLLDMLVDQIVTVGEGYKDGFGRIPLEVLINVEPDEADLLAIAVKITHDPELKKYDLTLGEALEHAEDLAAQNTPWREGVQRALDALTRGEVGSARAVLSKLPGLRGPGHDPQRVANGILMVSMAAQSARNPERLARHLVHTRQPEAKARAAMVTLSRQLKLIHLR